MLGPSGFVLPPLPDTIILAAQAVLGVACQCKRDIAGRLLQDSFFGGLRATVTCLLCSNEKWEAELKICTHRKTCLGGRHETEGEAEGWTCGDGMKRGNSIIMGGGGREGGRELLYWGIGVSYLD